MTSHAPSDAAAAPLFIRTDSDFSIDDTVRSVLDFTVMHAGAPTPPRLPVTIHNADHIAHGIRRGLFPSEIDSAAPFWL
jgi:argonaute-like protein implicated in RNA metabolism and viral defense